MDGTSYCSLISKGGARDTIENGSLNTNLHLHIISSGMSGPTIHLRNEMKCNPLFGQLIPDEKLKTGEVRSERLNLAMYL